MSTSAAEEAVKALGERDDVLLLNALKLVASIAAHPGMCAGVLLHPPAWTIRTACDEERCFF